MAATHGAAGNKKGVSAASKFRLLPREAVVPRMSQAATLFPVDETFGLLTPEQIAEAKARLGVDQ